MSKGIAVCALISILLNIWVFSDRARIIEARDKYKQNTETLLSDIRQYKLDSTRNVTETSKLKLTIDEYKKYREDDLKTIDDLGIRLKQLQYSLEHQVSINVPFEGQVRDSFIIRHDSLIKVPAIKFSNQYVKLDATLENNILKGLLELEVKLKQYIYTVPKHRFLWFRWGVKGINQIIISDNPYVKISYSEFIEISKK